MENKYIEFKNNVITIMAPISIRNYALGFLSEM